MIEIALAVVLAAIVAAVVARYTRPRRMKYFDVGWLNVRSLHVQGSAYFHGPSSEIRFFRKVPGWEQPQAGLSLSCDRLIFMGPGEPSVLAGPEEDIEEPDVERLQIGLDDTGTAYVRFYSDSPTAELAVHSNGKAVVKAPTDLRIEAPFTRAQIVGPEGRESAWPRADES